MPIECRHHRNLLVSDLACGPLVVADGNYYGTLPLLLWDRRSLVHVGRPNKWTLPFPTCTLCGRDGTRYIPCLRTTLLTMEC